MKTVNFFEFKSITGGKIYAYMDSRFIYWNASAAISDDDAIQFLVNDRDKCDKDRVKIGEFIAPIGYDRHWIKEVECG